MSALMWVVRRLVVVGVLSALLFGEMTAPAAAHVLIDDVTPSGDGSISVTMTFDHSCVGAPTTELIVQAPSGSELLGGSGPDGWVASVDGRQVRFTGPGIGDSQNPAFTINVRLVGSVGETVMFPTEQICADGDRYDWSDADESQEHPAPRLIATAATLAEVTATASGPQSTDASASGEGASGVQVAVALIIVIGAAWLVARYVLGRGRGT